MPYTNTFTIYHVNAHIPTYYASLLLGELLAGLIAPSVVENFEQLWNNGQTFCDPGCSLT